MTNLSQLYLFFAATRPTLWIKAYVRAAIESLPGSSPCVRITTNGGARQAPAYSLTGAHACGREVRSMARWLCRSTCKHMQEAHR
jgi:hypothetical protein